MRALVLALVLSGCVETVPPQTYRITVTTHCAECDGGIRSVELPQ